VFAPSNHKFNLHADCGYLSDAREIIDSASIAEIRI
jgi:hypothetical protein